MVGRRGQETLVIQVAAHDPVQDDDVVRLDFARGGRNVDLTAVIRSRIPAFSARSVASVS
jgi:hypothetical protein